MKFWQHKTLAQMTKSEWESLCDGCAKCCLLKLQDQDTEQVFYTSVACKLLDLETCSCTDYQNRNSRVPECIWLKSDDLNHLDWLPSTCAYRLLSEGRDLPSWHHLVSGDTNTVFSSGVAIASFAIQDVDDEDLEDFIIEGIMETGYF